MGAGALSKSRSKSIGHNLHQKMMVLDMERERAEGTKSQMTSSMPWSSQSSSKPPALRRRDANNARNYELRMSKSSDSITAAKMMAMRQMQQQGQGRSQGLRINQDMSKSMEKQIDVYTKTRDDIRKILQVPPLLKIASACCQSYKRGPIGFYTRKAAIRNIFAFPV